MNSDKSGDMVLVPRVGTREPSTNGAAEGVCGISAGRAKFEAGTVEWWLQCALDCPAFPWDADQHECASLALVDRARPA